jgi:hypothetical protein
MNWNRHWDLASIPDDLFKSEWARRCAQSRTTYSGGRNGGRPVELVPCPRCGQQVSKTEARRGHGCQT